MRLIDADALIDDLKHDVAMDQDSLDYEELTDSNREKIQFDKDCKRNAIDFLQNAPTIEPEQMWIPCSERLPEEYGNYLVTTDDGDVDIGTIDTDSKKWNACDANGFFWIREVIAWMSLPEPYTEDGREK